ncbi:retron St85 family RNA-directed DNA polymerase [Spartinivicinus ruber]|uniref:retron St85 family RNA-directed DNA polymerase n=1 Tax=Spartinivicinus ruber TaxID=2683272 RepID=UPI0013D156C1|nr:retron St85 family RNA-directed DNA polymerase [Spartinivicinus ruber]
MKQQSKINQLWNAIEKAGSMNAYIDGQLREHGFLVKRRDTDNMSKRELDRYKKELKAEAAEKKRLKQVAWQAYKANHIVHLGDGIYWNDHDDFDRWDLNNAEERAAENELPPLDKPQQLAHALGITIPQLRWLAFHRDAATELHYRRFTIPKKDGSDRAIWAPKTLLKQAQYWINDNITRKLIVHGAAHGFIPGRSILSNAEVHTNSKIILKMDLENFFPTITLKRVKGLFRKAGYREQIATLLALLVTEAPREVVEDQNKTYFVSMGPRCLPQGAPTSPMITNALCLKLDRRLTGIAEKYGWRYSRYADDLTFSLPDGKDKQPNLGKLMHVIKQIVKDEGFIIHPEKTRITRKGGRQKITGLVVNGQGTPRVPQKTKRELRAAIHNLKNGKPLREGETLAHLEGLAAFICMTEPALGHKMLNQLKAVANTL